MFDFAALNELIGTPEMLALGKRYEGRTTPMTASIPSPSRS